MGYTHYWQQPAFTPMRWNELCDACHKIIGCAAVLHGVRVCGATGEGKAVIDQEVIALNGDGSAYLDHETFALRPGGASDFCKTARKPYDTVVTAILAYGAAYQGFDVSSDGYTEEWEDGTTLANRALGIPVPNPLFVKDLKDGS